MKGVTMSKDKGEDTDAKDEGARSFGVFLAQFAEGTLNAELSETLREAVKMLEQHASDYGKAKGTLTLTLTLVADRDRDVIAIVPDVKTKLPKSASKAGIFWVKGSGELVAENPRQQKLPLAVVPQAHTRAVPINAPAPERSVP
jgi:hypothetical protein